MSDQKWLTVARLEDLKPGLLLQVRVGKREIALANVEGEFYAFNDLCPHEDFPLSEGDLEGCKITCALHGWSFNLKTTRPYPPLLRPFLVTYPTRIKEEVLQISLD